MRVRESRGRTRLFGSALHKYTAATKQRVWVTFEWENKCMDESEAALWEFSGIRELHKEQPLNLCFFFFFFEETQFLFVYLFSYFWQKFGPTLFMLYCAITHKVSGGVYSGVLNLKYLYLYIQYNFFFSLIAELNCYYCHLIPGQIWRVPGLYLAPEPGVWKPWFSY